MFFFDKNPQYAKNILFIDQNEQSITYRDWYNQATALYSIMKPRSLAFILCRNTIGSMLSYLCCLQNRIVPILLADTINNNLLNNLLVLYKPQYIFQPSNQANHEINSQKLFTLYDYCMYEYLNNLPTSLFDQLALLLTTSGSTGSPKLVRQSYENIQANASSIATFLKLSHHDRPITSLPMHYTFGLSVINSHVLCGATIYLTTTSVFDKQFWQLCQENSITSMAGVPFTYECLKKLRFFKMDLPALNLLIQAGGKLSATLQKEYAAFATNTSKRFIIMYGQTEATARMSYLPASQTLTKIGSIGIPIPGGTFHIMKNKTIEVTLPGIYGEICYDGPNVTLGYADCRDDLSHQDDWQGRLWTGDIGYKDSDGYYYIIGRKKRFLKIMGKRVNMDEIEQLCKNIFPDYDFACIGHDDNLQLFTTITAEKTTLISDFLTEKLDIHTATFTIHIINKLPKTLSGKTQYDILEKIT